MSKIVEGQSRHSRLTPGLSIAGAGLPAGSLGLIVHRADLTPYVLSAYHVLGSKRRPVLQPAVRDEGRHPEDLISSVLDAYVGSLGEAAIAPIVQGSGRTFANRPFHDSGVLLSSVRSPVIGERLHKCGRTSGLSHGIVTRKGWQRSDLYPGLKIYGFYLRSDSGSGKVLTQGGDSGAVWYSRDDGAAVGLHLVGEKSGTEWAFACPLSGIMKKLGVHLSV